MSSITLSERIEKLKTIGIVSIFGRKAVSEPNPVEDDILLERMRCVIDNTAID
ncbi:MAG: hypothetical protein AB6733_18675 [Clostridiaceae bacterium]